MVKKLLFLVLLPVLVILFSKQVFAQQKIYFFYGEGCQHCAAVEGFFEERNIYNRYPIDKREIYFDHDNALYYNQILDLIGIDPSQRGVPTVIVGEDVLVGDTPIIQNFERLADTFILEQSTPQPSVSPQTDQTKSDLTLVAVLAASAVDAINPCAFAVLIILMSTILVTKDSKKALKAGVLFSFAIFISYFLMGLGLYKALSIGSISVTIVKVVGVLAIILGLFNLKDWLWYGKGVLMEVPLSWRPSLKRLIGSVSTPIVAFGVGFLVSLFLLPCTSGPYIVILGMLSNKAMQTQAIIYLLIYNAVFVLPMIVITLLVYRGLNPDRLESLRQKNLRNLHLIAGVILILMGLAVLAGWV